MEGVVRRVAFTGTVLYCSLLRAWPKVGDVCAGALRTTRVIVFAEKLLDPAGSKCIPVRFHFVRELLRSGKLDVFNV